MTAVLDAAVLDEPPLDDESVDDATRWEIFQKFRRETPMGFFDDPGNVHEMFWGRLIYERWRQTWLPYVEGLTEGPTTREEYAELRAILYGRRRPVADLVDRFHS